MAVALVNAGLMANMSSDVYAAPHLSYQSNVPRVPLALAL
jgi:hypothetical protein